jgi:hypothetical protein
VWLNEISEGEDKREYRAIQLQQWYYDKATESFKARTSRYRCPSTGLRILPDA